MLLLLSGAAALVYQLLWIKQLSLIVGAEVHAVTIGISAFFAGLALGSVLFGRRSDRVQRPLQLYALIEVGVALAGIAATWLLAHSAGAFARLEATVGPLAWLLPFVLVGLPATLMGGTVPVLVRAIAGAGDAPAAVAGRLYGANTAGAIIGALLTVFALIPSLGVFRSAFAAAMLNVLAAAGAWLVQKRTGPVDVGIRATDSGSGGCQSARLALALYAVSGGLALAYEVVWSQIIVQWTSTRAFAFAVVLATYLLGWAIGSAAFAKQASRTSQPWGMFGALISVAALVSLASVMALGPWLQSAQTSAATITFELTHREPFAMAARFLLAAGWVVLVPTILLGAAFPFVMRIVASSAKAGSDTGSVIAWNTAGGIAGTMIAGFVLVPMLGLERSLGVLAVGSCIVGVVAVMHGHPVRALAQRVAIACAVLAVAAAVVIRPDHLANLLAEARGGSLVFFEPGAGGTVAVIEQDKPPRAFRRLYVDGVSNSGDAVTSLRYMRLQALLPLVIHNGEPRSALVIGLGTGITSGALLAYSDLDTRVVAELLPGIVHAVPLFNGNYNVASNPRIEIRVRDGRRELLRSDQRYDVITLEPPPPSAAGVVNLYSTDFYRLAAQRLNEHGLVAQWLPLPTQTDADTRSLVRSFIDVFPYATLWTTELHEMLLIGSPSPIELDARVIARRFAKEDMRSALGAVGVDSPQALLATWVMDRSGLERYAAAARPVTDDDPRIEYGPWVMPDELLKTLPNILVMRSSPVVTGTDASFATVVAARHDTLMQFYEAGLLARTGDRRRWGEAMSLVIAQEPGNPYYRSFVESAIARD